ncbi:hypothetical protein [Microbacterium sp. PA5]|uniref:hypothetical protein n=1 Tax=Microbacterium sp. PA5 TaxID=3416654 RepID=UPI003CE94A1F
MTVVFVVGACSLGLVLGTAANAAVQAITSPVPQPMVAVSKSADYDLNVLTSPTSEARPLPKDVARSDIAGGLDVATARLIEDGPVQSFVVKSNLGLLCLVVHIDDKEWVTGTVCTTPAKFRASGLGMVVEARESAKVAERYLLSDSSVASNPAVSSFQTGDVANLLVVDDVGSVVARDALRTLGKELSFEVLK